MLQDRCSYKSGCYEGQINAHEVSHKLEHWPRWDRGVESPLYYNGLVCRNMSLKSLYLKLKAEVDEETSRGNSCCVIIDDYSILLSLGLDLSHLVDFIHYLRVMLCSSSVRI